MIWTANGPGVADPESGLSGHEWGLVGGISASMH